jgi:hypothetical protein
MYQEGFNMTSQDPEVRELTWKLIPIAAKYLTYAGKDGQKTREAIKEGAKLIGDMNEKEKQEPDRCVKDRVRLLA